ncbi:MAG: sn-glycerol-1-phosphate dehydrogenase [Caldilineaceae bacterium]|nr:sn-glycerol-1-phosphate dehydrogenase [Caldilineaceae bacterium]
MSGERPLEVTIDDLAIEHLLAFTAEQGMHDLLMVSDENTYAALGARVEAALSEAGRDLISVIHTGEEVVADARYIFHTLLAADPKPRTYIAVGSGTVTDITRFVSHRTHSSFISMPTAPSVDGFASIGAPLIIDGVKETVICHAPIAIFADINTLANAPQALIAAGLGDMLGKYTSIADWRLGRLFWGEPYDEEIAQRTLAAVQLCVDNVDAIGADEPEGIRKLLEGLIESGYCMLDFGSSRPASGAEHHYSHLWEMKLLREGRPAILHGAKVGVATVLVAGLYDRIRAMSRNEAADLMEASDWSNADVEMTRIRTAYGNQAEDVMAAHQRFLNLTPEESDAIKRQILAHWDEVQEIAAHVPPPDVVADYLRRAGGPTTVAELGLSDEEQALAEQSGHYLRDRFTVRKLARALDI